MEPKVFDYHLQEPSSGWGSV